MASTGGESSSKRKRVKTFRFDKEPTLSRKSSEADLGKFKGVSQDQEVQRMISIDNGREFQPEVRVSSFHENMVTNNNTYRGRFYSEDKIETQ